MVSRPKSTLRGRLLFLAVPTLLGTNIVLTCVLTLTSINNYPGGQALTLFHEFYPRYPRAHVHISNLAAQTGASLFLQLNAAPLPPAVYGRKDYHRQSWTYNKTESLTIEELTGSKSVTHLIAESKPDTYVQRHWKVVASVEGFKQWKLDWAILKLRPSELATERLANAVKMYKEEKLWILERI